MRRPSSKVVLRGSSEVPLSALLPHSLYIDLFFSSTDSTTLSGRSRFAVTLAVYEFLKKTFPFPYGDKPKTTSRPFTSTLGGNLLGGNKADFDITRVRARNALKILLGASSVPCPSPSLGTGDVLLLTRVISATTRRARGLWSDVHQARRGQVGLLGQTSTCTSRLISLFPLAGDAPLVAQDIRDSTLNTILFYPGLLTLPIQRRFDAV